MLGSTQQTVTGRRSSSQYQNTQTIRLPRRLQPVVRIDVRKGCGGRGHLAGTTASNVAPVRALLAWFRNTDTQHREGGGGTVAPAIRVMVTGDHIVLVKLRAQYRPRPTTNRLYT